MAVKVADVIESMNPEGFPAMMGKSVNLVKEDGTEKSLQAMFDDKELGGGGNGLPTPEAKDKVLLTKINGDTLKPEWQQVDKGEVGMQLPEFESLEVWNNLSSEEKSKYYNAGKGYVVIKEDVKGAKGVIDDTKPTSTVTTLSAKKISDSLTDIESKRKLITYTEFSQLGITEVQSINTLKDLIDKMDSQSYLRVSIGTTNASAFFDKGVLPVTSPGVLEINKSSRINMIYTLDGGVKYSTGISSATADIKPWIQLPYITDNSTTSTIGTWSAKKINDSLDNIVEVKRLNVDDANLCVPTKNKCATWRVYGSNAPTPATYFITSYYTSETQHRITQTAYSTSSTASGSPTMYMRYGASTDNGVTWTWGSWQELATMDKVGSIKQNVGTIINGSSITYTPTKTIARVRGYYYGGLAFDAVVSYGLFGNNYKVSYEKEPWTTTITITVAKDSGVTVKQTGADAVGVVFEDVILY